MAWKRVDGFGLGSSGRGGGHRNGESASGPRSGLRRPTERPIDPYWAFSELTDFAFVDRTKSPLMPIILRLREGLGVTAFAAGRWHSPSGWESWLQIPALYHTLPPALKMASYCTAMVSEEFFDHMVDDPLLHLTIVEWELCLPAAPPPMIRGNPLALEISDDYARPSAIVGIIDDALAFAHERFRCKRDATRIIEFWDQDHPANSATFPGYGKTLTQVAINNELAQSVAGLVDEDAIYRRLGNARVDRRASHGAHVMDVAGGEDVESLAALPQAPPAIVGVQLPSRVTRDTSGGSLANYALDGLHYIIQVAAAFGDGQTLPIVVNLSYGAIAGPHDGSSPLERALDEVLVLHNAANPGNPARVVLPAGNSHLARCHAQFRLHENDSKELRWRVQPDDWTPSFVEIWLPHAKTGQPPAKVEVVVTPAGHKEAKLTVTEGTYDVWQPGSNNLLCAAIYPMQPSWGDRHRVLVATVPTFSVEAGRDAAPAGTWKITVRNLGEVADIDAWVQRDDTPFGFPRRGRQSRFDDERYQRFDDWGRELEVDNGSHIKRAGSINSIATGRETIVVGACYRKDERIAPYSAGGPTIAQPGGSTLRAGPDALSISDDSVVFHGVLAAGTRSGSVVPMYGTSVAAPAVTRWIAGQMAAGAGQQTGRADVRAAAAAKPTPPALAARGGAGRIVMPTLSLRRFEP